MQPNDLDTILGETAMSFEQPTWLEGLEYEIDMWRVAEAMQEHEGGSPSPQPTWLGYALLVLWDRALRVPRVLWCWQFGHDFEVEGWATPDTGGEAWHCRRCGVGGSHTYY